MPATVAAPGLTAWYRAIAAKCTTRMSWARGGRTDADELFFGCGGDHGMASRRELHTIVTKSGRLGWTDGTGPPEINHAHHPDELLRGDPDP